MRQYLKELKPYWNERFLKEGRIWGDAPSSTAEYALKLFQNHKVKSVLVPGAGYGRNTKLFSTNGLRVVGIEISDLAIQSAYDFDPLTTFHNRSVLEIDSLDETFDVVYCFNVLHLFREAERSLFIDKCSKILNENGLLFFVVFSEREDSFGKGKQVEVNTFKSKPGRPVHYFTEEDLLDHFQNHSLIETGTMEDKENHGEQGEHVHMLRYIVCSKQRD